MTVHLLHSASEPAADDDFDIEAFSNELTRELGIAPAKKSKPKRIPTSYNEPHNLTHWIPLQVTMIVAVQTCKCERQFQHVEGMFATDTTSNGYLRDVRCRTIPATHEKLPRVCKEIEYHLDVCPFCFQGE